MYDIVGWGRADAFRLRRALICGQGDFLGHTLTGDVLRIRRTLTRGNFCALNARRHQSWPRCLEIPGLGGRDCIITARDPGPRVPLQSLPLGPGWAVAGRYYRETILKKAKVGEDRNR
jgi:hypothetical protein